MIIEDSFGDEDTLRWHYSSVLRDTNLRVEVLDLGEAEEDLQSSHSLQNMQQRSLSAIMVV